MSPLLKAAKAKHSRLPDYLVAIAIGLLLAWIAAKSI